MIAQADAPWAWTSPGPTAGWLARASTRTGRCWLKWRPPNPFRSPSGCERAREASCAAVRSTKKTYSRDKRAVVSDLPAPQ